MAKVLALTLALSTAVSAMELTPETWDDAVAGKTGAKKGGGNAPHARAHPVRSFLRKLSAERSRPLRAPSRAVFIKFLAPW